MTTYYSKSTKGFYISEIHKDNIPEDKVEISEDLHKALVQGQCEGKIIDVDAQGTPCLVDKPVCSDKELVAANNSKIILEIKSIERDLQPRAMRDVVLYNDNARLLELDKQIADLRSQLK